MRTFGRRRDLVRIRRYRWLGHILRTSPNRLIKCQSIMNTSGNLFPDATPFSSPQDLHNQVKDRRQSLHSNTYPSHSVWWTCSCTFIDCVCVHMIVCVDGLDGWPTHTFPDTPNPFIYIYPEYKTLTIPPSHKPLSYPRVTNPNLNPFVYSPLPQQRQIIVL